MSRLHDAVRTVAEAVCDSAEELNRLDGAAGDGDLGVTMTIAATSVLELLPELEGKGAADVLLACGSRIARDAPSTSGTLVASGLLAAARAAGEATADLPRFLEAAAGGIVARGKAEPGDKTMLDALSPAVEAARESARNGDLLEDVLKAAASAARAGSGATVRMTPRHGRAGWLAERSAGVEDPGARLVAIVLSAASDALMPSVDR